MLDEKVRRQRWWLMRAIGSIMVDDELCKACGICVDLCPKRVYDLDKAGKPVVVRLDDCNGCLFCEWHCPDFAVRVQIVSASPQAVELGADGYAKDAIAAVATAKTILGVD